MDNSTLWARANSKCPNRYWFQLTDVPPEEALSAQRKDLMDYIESNEPEPPTVIQIVSEVKVR